jgi:hypothetical protein
MKFCGTALLGFLVCYITVGNAAAGADATREASAITCFQGMSEKVPFRSTDRLPRASGEAKVERRGGTTDIEIRLDEMKPASLFGGDYNTYVLWVVSPSGRAENLGELALEGDRSTLHAVTDATTMAILVTAEPHYLVRAPSAFVVLESKGKSDARTSTIEYPVLQGIYNFERSTLNDVKKATGTVHTSARQAFSAVRLARRAGAANVAMREFADAERALDETFSLLKRGINRSEIDAQARETVRLAVAAQRLAEDHAFQDARVRTEGSGGGNGELEGADPRGLGTNGK